MNHMTVDRWLELVAFMLIYALMLYDVRFFILQNVRFKAIDLISELNRLYIDNGLKYDELIWEKCGFGKSLEASMRAQIISLNKWNFEDFYPDLARFESYLKQQR